MAGLMYHQPQDPIEFLLDSLNKVKATPPPKYSWNLFVGKRRQLKAPSRVQTGQHRKPPAQSGAPLAPISPTKATKTSKPLTPAHAAGVAKTPLPPIQKHQNSGMQTYCSQAKAKRTQRRRASQACTLTPLRLTNWKTHAVSLLSFIACTHAEIDAKGDDDKVVTTVEAIQKSNPENRMAKHFDVEYYKGLGDDEKKGLVQCCRSGLENPDSSMGCYAMQPADYDRFKPFFSKVIADYHGVSVDAKHVNNWDLGSVEGLPEGGKLDLEALGLPALSMRVRVGRNLADFPLPGAMTQEDRVKLESKVCDVCDVCDECDECDECVFWERGGGEGK